MVSFRPVRARHGKVLRAEPVAALYEQGRVRHRGIFRELEGQMLAMTSGGYAGQGSPDRVDALVWAITELMVEPTRQMAPGVRIL
jgi:phage terminase large subunit-like protein